MDRKQLVTIAITAVLSVTAREVFTWIVAWAKAKAQSETTRATARTVFSKKNRKIIWDVLWFAIACAGFWETMTQTSPVTRREILEIPSFAIFLFLWFMFLLRDTKLALSEWRESQKENNSERFS